MISLGPYGRSRDVVTIRSVLCQELHEMHRPEIADLVKECELLAENSILVVVLNRAGISNDDTVNWLGELLLEASYRAAIPAQNVAVIMPCCVTQT
jgi:hypothetical protein